MMGRVTQNMLSEQLIRNLNTNLNGMSNLQEQASTSRRINRPSDDPVGLTFSMRYRSDLSANEQYQSNVDSAMSWMDFNDTLLDQIGNVLHRVRELTVQAANGTNTDSSLEAIKKEVLQLTEQLITVGNSKFNGKYVFNGQITDQPPYATGIQEPVGEDGVYVVNAKASVTDDSAVLFDIANASRLQVNVTGNTVFGVYTPPAPPVPPATESEDTDDSLFNVMEDLINALHQRDNGEVGKVLARLDTRMTSIVETRSEIGARLARIELASDRLLDINTNLQTLQSKVEDVDMAELIMRLKTKEAVYQASLSIGSKVISPTLVDFLR